MCFSFYKTHVKICAESQSTPDYSNQKGRPHLFLVAFILRVSFSEFLKLSAANRGSFTFGAFAMLGVKSWLRMSHSLAHLPAESLKALEDEAVCTVAVCTVLGSTSVSSVTCRNAPNSAAKVGFSQKDTRSTSFLGLLQGSFGQRRFVSLSGEASMYNAGWPATQRDGLCLWRPLHVDV